jgi:hypothetical protein
MILGRCSIGGLVLGIGIGLWLGSSVGIRKIVLTGVSVLGDRSCRRNLGTRIVGLKRRWVS